MFSTKCFAVKNQKAGKELQKCVYSQVKNKTKPTIQYKLSLSVFRYFILQRLQNSYNKDLQRNIENHGKRIMSKYDNNKSTNRDAEEGDKLKNERIKKNKIQSRKT